MNYEEQAKIDEGCDFIRKIVFDWSKVYISQVFFVNKFSNIYK